VVATVAAADPALGVNGVMEAGLVEGLRLCMIMAFPRLLQPGAAAEVAGAGGMVVVVGPPVTMAGLLLTLAVHAGQARQAVVLVGPMMVAVVRMVVDVQVVLLVSLGAEPLVVMVVMVGGATPVMRVMTPEVVVVVVVAGMAVVALAVVVSILLMGLAA
jgi:hypothetical protein